MNIENIKLKEIDTINYNKLFSICTLVSNMDEYKLLVKSLYKAGFNNDNSEFIYIDNSIKNKYDAFNGLDLCLNKSIGKYIILVHQDVIFEFDNIDVLLKRIDEMDKYDSSWAILGNTGYAYDNINKQYTRISDPFMDNQNNGPFPIKVSCVDENIMIVKNEANLMFSNNIGHFHLYGADLSINAINQGYTTYVIDFHIRHNSGGYPNQSFYDTKKRLINQYQQTLKNKFFRTPCTVIFISKYKLLNYIMNTKFMYSIKKRYDKIRTLLNKEGI